MHFIICSILCMYFESNTERRIIQLSLYDPTFNIYQLKSSEMLKDITSYKLWICIAFIVLFANQCSKLHSLSFQSTETKAHTPLKFKIAPEELPSSKRKFIFQPSFFRGYIIWGYVKLRGNTEEKKSEIARSQYPELPNHLQFSSRYP